MCAAANLSDRYEINYEKPGIVLIFNNSFKDNPDKVRTGSENDVKRIEALFKDKLKYRVEKFEDKTQSEIKDTIHTYSLENYTNDSVFICFIMSHGTSDGKNTIIETHDSKKVYLERDFVEPLKKNNF